MPWAAQMGAAWANVLGNCPERASIEEVLAHSLTEATAASYGSHFKRFTGWCTAQPDAPSPLPATTGTVLRWLAADVCRDRERVKAGSLQPYLSAINRVHRDLGHPEPALGHLITQYRKGLGHVQSAGRDAERVYLPASVVARALDWALGLDLERATTAQRSAFRAATATVLTFCFFARGATGAHLQVRHVRRSVAGLSITLEHEKGKKGKARSRVITMPFGAVPGLDELLSKWESYKGGGVKATASYYALPGERSKAWPSTQIDVWAREVFSQLGVQPPPGELWSGHSLRKGAASASAAIGVVLDKICWCGGWSIHSQVVHDYIDPTCPSSSAAWRFFSWLLPGPRPS